MELDNDDDKYRDMLMTSPALPGFEFDYNEKLEEFLCKIVEKGNVPYEKDPLGWDASSVYAMENAKMHDSIYYKLYQLQQKGNKLLNRMKHGKTY